jgi:N-acetylglutamate synthase-like GNAT family acetyltransferase
MVIRRANSDDLGRVAALLQGAGLPPLPSAIPLANVLVALEDGSVVGAIALQVSGLRGLMWPAVVAPSHLDGGLRTSLLQTLIARAHELSLRELFLVAQKDADFFEGMGFERIASDAVPMAFRSGVGDRDRGSESETAMRLQLVTRSV